MFLHGGLKFDRFGDEVSGSDTDEKILQLKTEFAHSAKAMFDQVKNKNDEDVAKLSQRLTNMEKVGDLYSVTNTYFSTKGRRLVSVARGLDKNDVPTMEQLNEVHNKVKKILKAIEITEDCIKIKGHRRICNVNRAKDIYDCVTDVQRIELNNQLADFNTQINSALATIREEFTSELSKSREQTNSEVKTELYAASDLFNTELNKSWEKLKTELTEYVENIKTELNNIISKH